MSVTVQIPSDLDFSLRSFGLHLLQCEWNFQVNAHGFQLAFQWDKSHSGSSVHTKDKCLRKAVRQKSVRKRNRDRKRLMDFISRKQSTNCTAENDSNPTTHIYTDKEQYPELPIYNVRTLEETFYTSPDQTISDFVGTPDLLSFEPLQNTNVISRNSITPEGDSDDLNKFILNPTEEMLQSALKSSENCIDEFIFKPNEINKQMEEPTSIPKPNEINEQMKEPTSIPTVICRDLIMASRYASHMPLLEVDINRDAERHGSTLPPATLHMDQGATVRDCIFNYAVTVLNKDSSAVNNISAFYQGQYGAHDVFKIHDSSSKLLVHLPSVQLSNSLSLTFRWEGT